MWVKLERRGNVLTAYRSSNGPSWTLVGANTIALPTSAYVGLALTSHDNSRLAAAVFDNIVVSPRSGGSGGDTQAPTVSITSPAKDAVAARCRWSLAQARAARERATLRVLRPASCVLRPAVPFDM